jgi:RNA polymerase sigma-70 factor (ECF subfamily)
VPSDSELLEAWRAGDRKAGNELLERHFDALYRFFRNKVDREIDDLIQQTMLACIKGAANFRQESSFRTWLFSIARFELYGFWRSQRKDVKDIGEISIDDLRTTPGTLVARRREHQLLLTALRALPLDLQVAVELYYWEGLDGPELAEALEIPEGTARSRLRRAREALAAKMQELGGPMATGVSLKDLDAWAADVRESLK